MKALFVAVVIIGMFRSTDPASKNFIVKEISTGKIDTITWLDGHLKIKDTVEFEKKSFEDARYGKKYFIIGK
jgi:hypothetical protein